MQIDWFTVVAIIAIVVLSFLLFLALFEPGLDYKISSPYSAPLDSPEFLRMLESITDSRVNDCSRVEVLTNGEVYYEAELAGASARPRRSINLEAYIFQKGEVTRRFLEALTERARAGVEVRLVLDCARELRHLDELPARADRGRRARRLVSPAALAHPRPASTTARTAS